MAKEQLPLFRTGGLKRVVPTPALEVVKPTGDSTVMGTLPAYLVHLRAKYAPKTVQMYASDVRELSLYLRDRKLSEIGLPELKKWRDAVMTAPGAQLGEKTLARKVSAVITYFSWLSTSGAITKDPSLSLVNARVSSPLPDYLYDNEVEQLYQAASSSPRTYLLVMLLLETGMKSRELFRLTPADVDTSDPYQPELWIRHRGRASKKDRKVALPAVRFVAVYDAYRATYDVAGGLFPFSDRYLSQLFAELKHRSEIAKELTAKTLRHTHVVRAYRRGEDQDAVFDRIGLAPDSRKEAHEMYSKLAARGM